MGSIFPFGLGWQTIAIVAAVGRGIDNTAGGVTGLPPVTDRLRENTIFFVTGKNSFHAKKPTYHMTTANTQSKQLILSDVAEGFFEIGYWMLSEAKYPLSRSIGDLSGFEAGSWTFDVACSKILTTALQYRVSISPGLRRGLLLLNAEILSGIQHRLFQTQRCLYLSS
jgi:hypothetical protein